MLGPNCSKLMFSLVNVIFCEHIISKSTAFFCQRNVRSFGSAKTYNFSAKNISAVDFMNTVRLTIFPRI